MIPTQLQNPNFRFCLIRKQSKAPFEKEWEKNGYSFDDSKLLNHKFNYGVIGGYGNLRILDIDREDLVPFFKEKFKDTFQVQSGSKRGVHIYIVSSYDTNHVLKEGIGEFRAKNYQCVGPGSVHPTGNTYEILKDIPIKEYSSEEIKEILEPYLRDSITSPENKTKDSSRSGEEFKVVLKLIKEGKTKEDIFNYMKTYSKWNEAPPQYKELTYNKALNLIKENPIKEHRIDSMLSQEKKPFKSMAIGEHNGHFYFGSILYSGNKRVPIVILDDGTIYYLWKEKTEEGIKIEDEIQDKFGLKYRFELFDDVVDNLWSNKSIKEFKEDRVERQSFKEIFEKIKNKNEEFVHHPDKRVHSFVACDIISNYCYPLFNSKGRTYFQADFGSGKSRQSLIYQKLSFNSLFASSISPASFERVIESTGGTIIVDNFDNVSEELKPQILQVIEVYYKKGGRKVNADGKNHKPIAYNGYSPLVINNIIGLPEVTESRCNKIQMLKTDKKFIVDKKINEKDPFWNKTKDELHILILQNWKEVQKVYENLEVQELSARDLERVEAVLTIAKIMGEETFQEVLSLILQINEQQSIRELTDNWEFMIFEFLNESLKEQDSFKIKVNEITESLQARIIQSERTAKSDKLKFSHYVGKILKGVSIFKKSVSGGYVFYEVNRENLNKIISIKGFKSYLNSYPTNATNTPNTPNTTNTTINKNNQNKKEKEESQRGKSSVCRVSNVQRLNGLSPSGSFGPCESCSKPATHTKNNIPLCEDCTKLVSGNWKREEFK